MIQYKENMLKFKIKKINFIKFFYLNLNFSKNFLFYLNKKINIFLIFFNYLYKKEMGNCYAVNSTTEVSTEAPKYIYEDA